MTKLTDTQAFLLSTASQRENGSVLPLPDTIKPGGGTSKALAALLKRGLLEERETNDAAAVHRIDGDRRYALHLTLGGAAPLVSSRVGRPGLTSTMRQHSPRRRPLSPPMPRLQSEPQRQPWCLAC